MRAFWIAPASLAWCVLTALSRLLHRYGVRKSLRLPVRVIAVGNFEVGGTGKTPVVAQLAREAISHGRAPLILTRGYGGRWEKTGGVIEPRKTAAVVPTDPLDCGDEPALLSELVPSAWIGVGADRILSFKRVEARARELGVPAPDLVILDDGLQHLAIVHDVEVVLATSARPWQKIFREWPMKRATCAIHVWTKGGVPPFRALALQPWIRMKWKSELRSEEPDAKRPLWLVTGVAESEQVRASLEAAGWEVAAHSVCRDHAHYSRAWLEDLGVRAASGALRLATTGKDWVKWRALGLQLDDVVVFEPEIVWDEEGRQQWLRMLWAE
jgi:tetraacyldisaccharide 4'-kinase